MKTLAIVGIGYWGKNIIREFNKLAKIKYACSTGNKSNKNWLNQNYPDIKWTKNFNEILNDKTVDAIIICTPISTHYDYSKLSLEYGKHVFVEKPVTENSQDSIKLLELAKKKILIIFVGHIFLYSEIFKKIRSISKKENIKKIILDWKKCGTFNEKITLNLLTHEISIILEILGNPKKIYYNDYPNDKNNISIIATYNSKICSINISRISNLKKKNCYCFY